MNIETTLRQALTAFNEKQVSTKRKALTSIEGTMLIEIFKAALVEKMGLLRDSLESAASQADNELQRELDWATDIIVATIRMDGKMSVTVTDEAIQKYAAGFALKIDREEGRTELELINDTDSG